MPVNTARTEPRRPKIPRMDGRVSWGASGQTQKSTSSFKNQEFCRERPCGYIGNNLIVFAVHHQHRHADLPEVFRKVGLRKCNDAVIVRLGAAHHPLPPPILDDRLRRLRSWTVVAIE